jgi:hypothetical protein
VTGKKRTAREPLWKCRKRRNDFKTVGESYLSQARLNSRIIFGRLRVDQWIALEAISKPINSVLLLKHSQRDLRDVISARGQTGRERP